LLSAQGDENVLGHLLRTDKRALCNPAAGLELGYRLGKNGQSATELFGFVDDGIARDIKSAVSPGSIRKLASAGAGARFSLLGTTVAVEAAVPLSAGQRARLFVSVFRSF